MPKLLVLTHQLPSPFGGGVSVAYGTLKALAQQGWTLRVLSFADRERLTQSPPEGIPVETVPLSYRNTWWHFLKSVGSEYPFTTQKYRSSAFAQRLSRILAADPPDLVWFDHTHMGVYVEAVRRWSPAPTVLRAHNAEHQLWLQYSQLSPQFWKRGALRFQAHKMYHYERRVYAQVDRVIFLSERDRQAFPMPHARVIPPGVDLEYFTPQEVSPERKHLIFLGSMEWIPNLDGLRWFLKEVFPQLRKALPGLRLWVVGKNPPPNLETPGVKITGFVPDVRVYIRKGGLFVVPLRMASGVQIKILEALAMGIPVVTSEAGAAGVPHLRPALAIARTPEEWVQQVLGLFTSPERYYRLREEGLRRVRRYHRWEQVGFRLSQELQTLLKTT